MNIGGGLVISMHMNKKMKEKGGRGDERENEGMQYITRAHRNWMGKNIDLVNKWLEGI